MNARLQEILKTLSPAAQQILLQQAESLAMQPRPHGIHLRLDWARTIDSEHETGMEAQRAALEQWTQSIERSLDR
jgi:hypothetical protein